MPSLSLAGTPRGDGRFIESSAVSGGTYTRRERITGTGAGTSGWAQAGRHGSCGVVRAVDLVGATEKQATVLRRARGGVGPPGQPVVGGGRDRTARRSAVAAPSSRTALTAVGRRESDRGSLTTAPPPTTPLKDPGSAPRVGLTACLPPLPLRSSRVGVHAIRRRPWEEDGRDRTGRGPRVRGRDHRRSGSGSRRCAAG